MAALGRGLASLIPRRKDVEEAEDFIERIDKMEVDEDIQQVSEVAVAEDDPAEGVAEEEKTEKAEEAEEQPETEEFELALEEDEDGDDTDTPEQDELEEQAEEEIVARAEDAVVEGEEQQEEVKASEVDADIEPPSAPLVSPITVDAEPSEEDADLLAEEESAPVTQLPDDIIAAATTSDTEEEKEKKPAAKKAKKPRASKPKPKQEQKKEKSSKVEKAAGILSASAMRELFGEKVVTIALGDIDVNREQPRRAFDEQEMEELMQSIAQHGILQPLVVSEKENGKYEIIAGERRWRAAKQLQLKEVPCVIRRSVEGDRNRLELALIENIQRRDLNPIEEALGYHRLQEEYGLNHTEIGERVGKSRAYVTNVMRTLNLPAEIQRGLIDEKITLGHAKAILMVPEKEKQIRFYQHVVDEGLTVRKTEVRARNIQRRMNIGPRDPWRNRRRPQLAVKYEAALQEKYGLNVYVRFNTEKNRFQIIFEAHSEKEAEESINTLLGKQEASKKIEDDVLGA